MDERLLVAAFSGNTAVLLQLLQENPFVLATAALTSGQTPLHISALNGHVDFTRIILQLMPAFAGELNQDGFSPMHMASANGHIDLVALLLEFGREHSILRELCVQKSIYGRTPLHCAVIKGRVDVIGVLLNTCPELVQELTDQGETALHLAVKNNQREAFWMLVQEPNTKELVKLMDEEGNSVLHLATARKQHKIVRFLLSLSNVNVNATNSKGLTSLDILLMVPGLSDEMGMAEMLRAAGGEKSQNLQLSATQCGSRSDNNLWKLEDWLKEMRSGIMMMATLVATVTFQAALTPPGGFWQDWDLTNNTSTVSNLTHRPGSVIIYDFARKEFIMFLFWDTVGFLASLSIILALISPMPFNRDSLRWTFVLYAIYVIVISVQMVFLEALQLTTKKVYNRQTVISFISFWIVFGYRALKDGFKQLNKWWKKNEEQK